MRRSDAPQPGWYPDPTGGPLLRWWDGLDWTDDRRSPPTPGMDADPGATSSAGADDTDRSGRAGQAITTSLGLKSQRRQEVRDTGTLSLGRLETADVMTEARMVARQEVERAVQAFSAQARDATRRIEPLIAQYGDRVVRWVRNVGIMAVVVVVLWFLAQTIGAASLLDWIGDRIDGLTDESSAHALLSPTPDGHGLGA